MSITPVAVRPDREGDELAVELVQRLLGDRLERSPAVVRLTYGST